ncbi:hypothetical protein CDD81_1471 [Ophiocordyceps australis]|uniref:Aminoglycoside phosphotransferase domain-containing protein n=1 Tax=Ophiocordyceps australis TaxID=1399860 RepID=A0A2C5YFJ3_9HYPO|nr:hypothetical protein CDD81_1471 [Ophiocordyceps australis]
MDREEKVISGRVFRANRNTQAAKWNLEVLRRLRQKLELNPEMDILKLLTPAYSSHLEYWKQPGPTPIAQEYASLMLEPKSVLSCDDVRSELAEATDLSVISPLTPDILGLFPGLFISQGIKSLLSRARIVYQATSTVFSIDDKFAIKISPRNLSTEHKALRFLRCHLEDFLAPRSHGLVQLGGYYIMFSTYIPGRTLQEAWPELNLGDRLNVSAQLGELVRELRTVEFCEHNPLGGVWGEGCRDARRDVRHTNVPIRTVAQFENWMYTASQCSKPCVSFLHSLINQEEGAKVVLTHGALQPENIIVQQAENETWKIQGLVDWDASGYYPEYWEAFKATHEVHTIRGHEWSRYLPEIISPLRFPTRWMADRLLESGMEHSSSGASNS